MSILENVVVPDIGGASGVDIIELLVKPGDKIEIDTPLVTLESDKATMEIPSPIAGVVQELKVKLGDKVSEGDLILTCASEATSSKDTPKTDVESKTDVDAEQSSATVAKEMPKAANTHPNIDQESSVKESHLPSPSTTNTSDDVILAGPAARRLAHVLGVSLEDVSGTGRKSRVSKEDIEQYVKQRLASGIQSSSLGVMHAKDIDFSKFGSIETKPLNKIKKLTGSGVFYAWNTIPHVTQFDNADITDLEKFRQSEQSYAKAKGYKLTILAFVCKVVSKALIEFPQFNSSLDAKCENIIYKKYINIGIAVETPNGLVVPVIKDVDKLSVSEIAISMSNLSQKAREKGLAPADMSGGTFTISSLGGIGGTAFTPIVNSPEVAILGLSKSSMQPVFENGAFVPRLMLPLSLSYDHRVIDGAEAARFTKYISDALADVRRVLL